MKEKAFYQCEHCVNYIQHYNISDDRIYIIGSCRQAARRDI